MTKVLTSEQRQAYSELGFAFPVRIFSAEQAEYYRDQCDRLEGLLGGRPKTIEVRQMHFHFAWAYRLVTERRLLDAIEDLLGPDLLVSATELFAKHPHNPEVQIGWHRDGVYMGLDPARTVTAWIALSASTKANGAMQVLPEGSQRFAPASGSSKAGREASPTAPTISVELAPGEMSLHDVHVLHGSSGNGSQHKRVGFAIRFTTPATKPALHRPPAMLVRGRDDFGHFELMDPPGDDDPDRALPALRLSARKHLDGTLRTLKQLAPAVSS